jgi:N-acetylneuraminic acid mutarotase
VGSREQRNIFNPLTIIKRGDIPETRDEHTALIYEGSMVIFGGFVNGERTNDIYRYYFNDNRWEMVQSHSPLKPPKRAGHSAIILGDNMYIYGGKDEDYNKLGDIWSFSFGTYLWQEIKQADEYGFAPLPRSGHSACIYKDCMVIFGGIYEVTKELDDVDVFDFKKRKWV